MIGPLNSYQDVYVTACGEQFFSQREGRRHERTCPFCHAEIGGPDCDKERDEPKPASGSVNRNEGDL